MEAPNAKAERPEPIPYRPETGQHTDRSDRNEFVELARCRHRAWPPCSGLSRHGLETTERAARAERRPTLTGPVRVGLNTCVGRGEETGFQVEQRNWNGGSGESGVKYMLDFKSPIQGLLGVHSRYGLHTRAVTNS